MLCVLVMLFLVARTQSLFRRAASGRGVLVAVRRASFSLKQQGGWGRRDSSLAAAGPDGISNLDSILSDGKFSSESPPITWYPGHIAKAERELSDYLKKVDVVIEVRDARIPLSTTHPMVPEWVGQRPLLVAIARLDQISPKALKEWREYYAMNPAHPERPDAKVFFVDGKVGAGVLSLRRQALKAGDGINEKRARRGITPRAVRAAVIGFPNVGKSALINRLLGRKMAKSRNMPGVTRSLQWVRIGGTEGSEEGAIELLDSPGIIPARQFDQNGALKLAICNDIGEAAYDRVVVAAAMCDKINELHRTHSGFVDMRRIIERYDLPFEELTGEDIVYQIAEKYYKANSVSAADKLLGDFRKGLLGFSSLEAPFGEEVKYGKPKALNPKPKRVVSKTSTGENGGGDGEGRSSLSTQPLPVDDDDNNKTPENEIGRGKYEGW